MPSMNRTIAAAGREDQRPAVEVGHDEIRDIHADHDELAMGEIDDVHHAPDQRQPRRRTAHRRPRASRPPTMTWRRIIRSRTLRAASRSVALARMRDEGRGEGMPTSQTSLKPRGTAIRPHPALSRKRERVLRAGAAAASPLLLLPALERIDQLRRRRFLRPHGDVVLALELDEVGGRRRCSARSRRT